MDFIDIYENVIPEDLCARLIKHSNWDDSHEGDSSIVSKWRKEGVAENGTYQFNRGKLGREDYQRYLKFTDPDLYKECHEIIQEFVKLYVNKYDILQSFDLQSSDVKVQKTPVGGGYHMWHAEAMNGRSCTRQVTFMAYLNDVEEGGTTEFLYQRRTATPKAGSLVLWPAGWTHPHRGNPPYSNDKFIITGWYHLNN